MVSGWFCLYSRTYRVFGYAINIWTGGNPTVFIKQISTDRVFAFGALGFEVFSILQ